MQLSENRFIVVSRTVDDKISMAQQIKVEDPDGGVSYIFIKNAFVFQSDEAFEDFRKRLQEINLKSVKDLK